MILIETSVVSNTALPSWLDVGVDMAGTWVACLDSMSIAVALVGNKVGESVVGVADAVGVAGVDCMAEEDTVHDVEDYMEYPAVLLVLGALDSLADHHHHSSLS